MGPVRMIEPDWTNEQYGIRLYCADCLDVLPTLADGSVDAVVTDPPYGIGEAAGKNASRGRLAVAQDYGNDAWDNSPPPPEFFDEMRRVSQHQVVFGGNHLATWLGSSPSWIVWDKDNGKSDFADCELAWTSHKRTVRKIVWRWQGMLQEPEKARDKRVHPTQKPVGVMLWIIKNYTDPSSIVCDPYMGSGTTGVACVKLGRKFIGIEKEPKYFDIAVRCIQEAIDAWGLFANAQ